MAVQTSSVTTAAGGGTNLFLTPDGVGQVTVSTLAGAGAQPMGIDNVGELYHFNISDLAVSTVVAPTDLLMMEIATLQRQVTAQDLIDGTDAISLVDLSVTQLPAAAGGVLTYNNATGVFTYTPPTRQGLGAAALTDLSVTTAAAGTATGALAYNNTTGVFTFTPVAQTRAATNAQQRAGTLTTVYSSPATSVAKDAATTTGALLAPNGTTAQRPAGVRGMLRYNTTIPQWEYFDGAAWQSVVPAGLAPATNAQQRAGTITSAFSTPATSVAKDAATRTGAILLSGGTTAQRPAAATGMLRYNSSVNKTEWNNGGWKPIKNEDVPAVGGSRTATRDMYVVVTSAGQTVTLPAGPSAGDNLLVVVSGSFTNTVVSRNGSNIMGLAQNMTLDKAYAAMRFTYSGNAAAGWRLN